MAAFAVSSAVAAFARADCVWITAVSAVETSVVALTTAVVTVLDVRDVAVTTFAIWSSLPSSSVTVNSIRLVEASALCSAGATTTCS